jgi:hypothetical protein
MALYIRHDKVRELAAQLAERQGLNLTEAAGGASRGAASPRPKSDEARDAEAREVIGTLRAIGHAAAREEVLDDEFGQGQRRSHPRRDLPERAAQAILEITAEFPPACRT